MQIVFGLGVREGVAGVGVLVVERVDEQCCWGLAGQ